MAPRSCLQPQAIITVLPTVLDYSYVHFVHIYIWPREVAFSRKPICPYESVRAYEYADGPAKLPMQHFWQPGFSTRSQHATLLQPGFSTPRKLQHIKQYKI